MNEKRYGDELEMRRYGWAPTTDLESARHEFGNSFHGDRF
jgi:hypothetical protein